MASAEDRVVLLVDSKTFAALPTAMLNLFDALFATAYKIPKTAEGIRAAVALVREWQRAFKAGVIAQHPEDIEIPTEAGELKEAADHCNQMAVDLALKAAKGGHEGVVTGAMVCLDIQRSAIRASKSMGPVN